MSDTYSIVLTITSLDSEGAELVVERISGTNCDLFKLVYKNRTPLHMRRERNIFYLYRHLSTLPHGENIPLCCCISARSLPTTTLGPSTTGV